MGYNVATEKKAKKVSTDHLGPNVDPETLEREGSDAAVQPPALKQNWAWRSEIGHYDWMDSYTSSFDHDCWHDTSFD